jgi:hypothetical protein
MDKSDKKLVVREDFTRFTHAFFEQQWKNFMFPNRALNLRRIYRKHLSMAKNHFLVFDQTLLLLWRLKSHTVQLPGL